MTTPKKIGYGIAGFTLSLASVVFTAASLQFIIFSLWPQPHGFLFVFGTALSISIAAIALSWLALLKGLRHKAMIRGVWYQVYACVAIAIIGLLVLMFF